MEVAEPVTEPVDEAKLIEERRKRREAIKAKYKDQKTPLLVQALQLRDGADTKEEKAEPEKRNEKLEGLSKGS